ncbi:MAG: peroxidase-related enzyme [Pseudolabrys sp.]|nr:peroxidase-related enzyme [Pseudolabrys sp.]
MAKASSQTITKAGKSFKAAIKAAQAKSQIKSSAKARTAPVKAPAAKPENGPDDEPIIALDLPAGKLSPAMTAYFQKCQDKLGFVPNVLAAYAFDNAKLESFAALYNDLMLGASGLSKLEREMIAVAVSSQNRCYYCLTAHGAAVRQYSGNPLLGEQIVMNYRVARLNKRQRAMLDFAVKLTVAPANIEEADRERLRRAGFGERDIWDIAAVAGFFNMSNRVATATDMRPNHVYHGQAR